MITHQQLNNISTTTIESGLAQLLKFQEKSYTTFVSSLGFEKTKVRIEVNLFGNIRVISAPRQPEVETEVLYEGSNACTALRFFYAAGGQIV